MTMIDEKALEAAEAELSRVLSEVDYCMPTDGMARVLAAYEAAKAQNLALLVTPDRGRRVEHTVPAKPVAEPVAGCLLKAIETLPDDFTDDGNCCAGRLSAPPSKDGG